MKNERVALNPNKIVQYLEKPPEEFTKSDLIDFIASNEIRSVNFRYVAGDGRLKTLNFILTGKPQLDRLLSAGERVDGSSLFTYIDAASSDLYVLPRYKTAYVNPFATIPTVDILCAYYTKDGTPLASAPEHTVLKAHEALKRSTGLSLDAMGELEYYVLYNKSRLYPTPAQKGYQESSPFSQWEFLRYEAMQAIAQAGGQIKYGHSEVGNIRGEEEAMEQHEIEFMPVPIEDAADQIVIAKWVLRMLGHKYGVEISFAPKIMVGHAGSGLHVHSRLVKDGRNVMLDKGGLSDAARKLIAGYLRLAPSLTAFGNTVPTSFLRLVPHQEAPTNICWGDRNRSVLVRVPLGWTNVKDMIRAVNPLEKSEAGDLSGSQTVEFRCPDGSANVYFLVAGLAVAARHGLEMENALDYARELYVDVNIFSPEHKEIQDRLPQLPSSCWESADCLLRDRAIYERDGVFSPVVIDGLTKILKSYADKDLSERFYGKGEEIKKLVEDFFHCS